MLSFLRDVGAAHERLKKRVHAFRVPLSKRGQRLMGVVYFSVPVVGGYFVMKWTERQAERNFQLEEESIRSAAGASGKYVKQQNDELRKLLQEKAQ